MVHCRALSLVITYYLLLEKVQYLKLCSRFKLISVWVVDLHKQNISSLDRALEYEKNQLYIIIMGRNNLKFGPHFFFHWLLFSEV